MIIDLTTITFKNPPISRCSHSAHYGLRLIRPTQLFCRHNVFNAFTFVRLRCANRTYENCKALALLFSFAVAFDVSPISRLPLRGPRRGKRRGGCFFGDFLCTSKESYSPSEGEIKFSAQTANTVNNPHHTQEINPPSSPAKPPPMPSSPPTPIAVHPAVSFLKTGVNIFPFPVHRRRHVSGLAVCRQH